MAYDVQAEADRIAAERLASPAYQPVDSKAGVKAATVRVAAVSGKITLVRYWNPTTLQYEDTPPTFDPGKNGGVIAYGRNDTSNVIQRMRCDAVVKRPDGSTLKKTGQVMSTIWPTQEGYWAFNWLCDQPGVYYVDLTLFAEFERQM